MRITIDIDEYDRKESVVLSDDSSGRAVSGDEAAGIAPVSETPDYAQLDYVEETMETMSGDMETAMVDAEFVGAGPAGLDSKSYADEPPGTGTARDSADSHIETYAADSEDAGAGPAADATEMNAYEEITYEETVVEAEDSGETKGKEKSGA